MALSSQSYVFDPRPEYPLVLTVKRYTLAGSNTDPNGLTLIFTHGTGFQKEQWEPTIRHLYEVIRGKNISIRECWSIDCPNHGAAALLNEEILQFGYDIVFGWEEYARGIHSFLSGLGKGVDVDFGTKKLVGIGHSMGAVSLILSTTFQPSIKFHSFHLVEPMIIPPPLTAKRPSFLEVAAMKRRDIWASREEAYNIFKTRTFKGWDDRCIRILVEHGLRPLPTLDHPDKEGVTLSCTKLQEAATYRDTKGTIMAHNLLSTIVQRVPVHVLYGAIDDYLTKEMKDHVLTIASGGVDKFRSVVRIEGVGHLVVQEKPLALAEKIKDALKVDMGALSTKL